jgi:Helicase associated domain
MSGKFDDVAWQRGLAALLSFKKREGHCSVPRDHEEGGYRLGQWVAVQRYSRDDLDNRRKAQLNKIGFIWSERDRCWEEGFAALKAFKAREGHCYVPVHQVEAMVHLGHWVTVQRRGRHKMSRERRQRLNEVGFVWNGKHTKAMKRKLAALRSEDRRSTALAPISH